MALSLSLAQNQGSSIELTQNASPFHRTHQSIHASINPSIDPSIRTGACARRGLRLRLRTGLGCWTHRRMAARTRGCRPAQCPTPPKSPTAFDQFGTPSHRRQAPGRCSRCRAAPARFPSSPRLPASQLGQSPARCRAAVVARRHRWPRCPQRGARSVPRAWEAGPSKVPGAGGAAARSERAAPLMGPPPRPSPPRPCAERRARRRPHDAASPPLPRAERPPTDGRPSRCLRKNLIEGRGVSD